MHPIFDLARSTNNEISMRLNRLMFPHREADVKNLRPKSWLIDFRINDEIGLVGKIKEQTTMLKPAGKFCGVTKRLNPTGAQSIQPLANRIKRFHPTGLPRWREDNRMH